MEDSRYIKCPVCKKHFIKPPENVYKITVGGKQRHYCSYTCWRKAGGGQSKGLRGARK